MAHLDEHSKPLIHSSHYLSVDESHFKFVLTLLCSHDAVNIIKISMFLLDFNSQPKDSSNDVVLYRKSSNTITTVEKYVAGGFKPAGSYLNPVGLFKPLLNLTQPK